MIKRLGRRLKIKSMSITNQEANRLLEAKYPTQMDNDPNIPSITTNSYVIVPRKPIMQLIEAYQKALVVNRLLRLRIGRLETEKCIRPDIPCIYRNGRG